MGCPARELYIDVHGVCLESVSETQTQRFSPSEIALLLEYCRHRANCSDQSIFHQQQLVRVAGVLAQAHDVDPELLDLLIVQMFKAKHMDEGLELSRVLVARFPGDPRGWFRLAAFYSHLAKSSGKCAPHRFAWKLAMMLYGKSLGVAIESRATEDPLLKVSILDKLSSEALQAILTCAKHTEFDCLATENELADLPESYKELFCPWTSQIREAVLEAYQQRGEPDMSTILSLDSRERMCFYSAKAGQFRKLPRFFRWITPFRVAVMSTPRNADDIDMLEALGISFVVTLTKEEPLQKEWFSDTITNVFMPVSNYKAPTIAQVDNFFQVIESSSGGRATLVHCGGGKGRAGSFVACYLARYGFTGIPESEPKYGNPAGVINTVRKMRPGSIETEEQERFIHHFVKELWKRAESGGKLILLPEPEPENRDSPRLHIEGQFEPQACKLIVCCGIPGSGKSTVSRALAESGGWVTASQDDTGSRDACARVVSQATRQGRPVIVDRCNPTVADRQEWIDLSAMPANKTICLFFDYSEDLCLQRANHRLDHPTLEPGRARTAIRSMQKSLQHPTLKEKFGAVVTIRSIAEANLLIERVLRQTPKTASRDTASASPASSTSSSGASKLTEFHKFPRTRHLVNFGSASRDDLIMTSDEAEAFFRCSEGDGMVVTLEEKVDGANLGLSYDSHTGQIRVQNRSHFVTSKTHKQFSKLDLWLSKHLDSLKLILNPGPKCEGSRLVLFGEWLQATHSIRYTRLPDYFLAFDIYEVSTNKFWSRDRFSGIMKQTSIHTVPRIPMPPHITTNMFENMTRIPSQFYDGPLEGIYVRRDVGPHLLDRAKVVRKDFICGNTHWSKQIITNNIIIGVSKDET